jgi:RNA polymerase sigma-70 factor (ECF subfamily)
MGTTGLALHSVGSFVFASGEREEPLMPIPEMQHARVLVAEHLETLFRVAYRLTHDRHDAQDLVQDTCVTAAENMSTLAAMDTSIHWLLRVMHNRFLDGARRRKRSPFATAGHEYQPLRIASEAPGPEELLHQADGERALQRAFMRLDDTQRTLLSLRAEGYDLGEIETITGLAREVLRARLYSARRVLAQYLDETSDAAPSAGRVESGT